MKNNNPSGICRRDRLLGIALLGGMGLALLVVFLRNPSVEPIGFCFFRAVTGLYCPSCGTTRAMHLLLHGQVVPALRMNMLVPPLLFPLGYILFSEAVWRITRRRIPVFTISPPLVVIIGVALLLYGVLRNIPMFSFLAPTSV